MSTTEVAPTTDLYSELLTCLKTDKPDFSEKTAVESDTDYFRRMVIEIGKISEENWDKLSKPAQEWFNEAAIAVNALQPIKPCPGYVPSPVAETPAAPATPAPTAPQPTGKRGIMARVRELTLVNPTWNDAQLSEALAGEGWEKISADTVWLCRTEVNNVLKAAKNVGLALLPVETAKG